MFHGSGPRFTMVTRPGLVGASAGLISVNTNGFGDAVKPVATPPPAPVNRTTVGGAPRTVICSVADRDTTAVGANRTETRQLPVSYSVASTHVCAGNTVKSAPVTVTPVIGSGPKPLCRTVIVRVTNDPTGTRPKSVAVAWANGRHVRANTRSGQHATSRPSQSVA